VTHQSTPNPHPVLDRPTGAGVICFRLARLKRCHWFKKGLKIQFSEPKQLTSGLHLRSTKNALSQKNARQNIPMLAPGMSKRRPTPVLAPAIPLFFLFLFRELFNNRTSPGGAWHADAQTACGRGFGSRLRPLISFLSPLAALVLKMEF
jgi:hypothetical protein